jgi:hypothetical protein
MHCGVTWGLGLSSIPVASGERISAQSALNPVKKNPPRRSVVVFAGLIGVLTLASTVLLILAPAPLTPGATSSLFAFDTPASLDPIFDTQVPVAGARWRYIYIHHSKTAAGNAQSLCQTYGSLGDHFLICNGDGAADGELQIGHRWNQQTTAAPQKGTSSIAPTCISISLIGDFDQTLPTPTQVRRLTQLVTALQTRFHIPSSNILLVNLPNSPAGPGKYFPMTAFRDQLIP